MGGGASGGSGPPITPWRRACRAAQRLMTIAPKPTNSVQRANPQGLMVAQRGPHTVSLAVDVEPGKPIESIEPAMVSLMKTVLARLP